MSTGQPGGPVRFGIVGGGRRTELFLRLASRAPEHFEVTGVVARRPERRRELAEQWHVDAFASVADLLRAGGPELVVTAVPWAAAPALTRELVDRGVRVLSETPPAPDVDGLRELWDGVGGTGKVQVAEQYLRMPAHAVRHALVRDGLIGEPTSVQVSSTHQYHAVSMIRHLLGVGFAPATVRGHEFRSPLADPLSAAGWSGDATPRERTTTLATLEFGGAGGLYDFTENQWFNPLRTRRIVIRGSLGEIVDDTLVRLVDAWTPVTSHLVRRRTGTDLSLEGLDLDHLSVDGEVRWRNPFFGAGFSEDDLAVAVLLRETGAWARDEGPEPYPLAEACQDHLVALAIEESARRGTPVTTSVEAWAR